MFRDPAFLGSLALLRRNNTFKKFNPYYPVFRGVDIAIFCYDSSEGRAIQSASILVISSDQEWTELYLEMSKYPRFRSGNFFSSDERSKTYPQEILKAYMDILKLMAAVLNPRHEQITDPLL